MGKNAFDCRKLVSALFFLVFPMSLPEAAPDRPPQLHGFYATWLLSVDHLILEEERAAFLALRGDVEREIFVRRFFEVREAPDGTNPALERWRSRFEVARQRFRDLGTDRAKALLLAGQPAQVLGFGGCSGPLRPLEIWVYTRAQSSFLTDRVREEPFYLVFASPSSRQAGLYRHWSPGGGIASLMTSTPGRRELTTIDELFGLALTRPCGASTMTEMRTVKAALHQAWGAEKLRDALVLPPPSSRWLAEFASELASRPSLEAAPTELSVIGHFKWYLVLRGRIRIPERALARNADGLLFDRLVVSGDIYQAGRLVQPFRVVHHVAGPKTDSGTVELDFYRRLRPGTYQMNLRLEDGDGLALLREDREIKVSWTDEEAEPPAGYRQGFAGLLRPEVGVLTTFPSVRLLASGDELLAGEVEIEAVTTGGPIARLDFLLNGETIGSDSEPPWAVAFELGATPEPQVLEAVAFDLTGRTIAHDRAELNVGSPRFAVRLLEPRREKPSTRVKVALAVPLGESFERLELYYDDERFATLSEPPFVYPLPPGSSLGKIYLRAVAYLESGETAEDLVVLDRRPIEEIDVELVELYTSVSDAMGRPVLGLGPQDFQILEDGEEQALERFDTVEKLPINVTLLMDVSQSMRDRMGIATVSAERFFEKVLTPKDRASLMIFNHDIRLVVPFTADVSRLRHGASGIRAQGSTRLYDSLIYTLHYFGGRDGRKALVLLSDGHDVDSDFDFDQVMEHALRSGVAAYPIGLDLEHETTRSELGRLAAGTGGRFFTLASASGLDRVYRKIEQDLRSQYLLVYRPPQRDRGEFRRVEVKVLRNGLRGRTIHGYYP